MHIFRKKSFFHQQTKHLLTLSTILLSSVLIAVPASAATSGKMHSLASGGISYLQSPLDSENSFYMSSAPYVAKSSKSFLRGNYPGITDISYIKNGKWQKETWMVKGLLPSHPYLQMDETQKFHLFGVQKTSIKSWKSSDPSVASINQNGEILAKRPGTTRISCITRHGHVYTTIVDVLQRLIHKEDAEEESTSTPKESIEVLLSCEENTLFMQPGDSYKPKVTVRKISGNGKTPELNWTSSNVSVATVDFLGNIRAKEDGCTTISCQCGDQEIHFSINVMSDGKSGEHAELTLLTGNQGVKRSYDLHRQNSHDYDSYDNYLAWHGCAHCSLATVLGAYNSAYAHILPNEVISGIEKKYAPEEQWNKEHVEHSLRSQMPLSLQGISNLLTKGDVANEYIPSFQYKEARADILAHLKTGHPVIMEVRQKNCRTGKSSKRWTNSYHTMIFLGAFTDDRVLLCDSINRSWYDGGQRCKIVTIDDVMEYMFSSTKSTTKYYYDGADSDGGYIKIFEK